MSPDLLIAAILVIISVLGLLIVTRSHRVDAPKRDITSSRNSRMRGWGDSH
jgi:hypothetical protein